MPVCPLCNCTSLPTISLYLTHIRISHADVPGFKIICGLQGCKRSFTNFLTYRNHVYAHHDTTDEDSRHTSENENSGQNESGNEGALDNTQEGIEGSINRTVTPTVEDLVTEDTLQKTAAMWILKAREEHRIPLSVMDGMMGDFQSLHQVAMEACRHQVEATLKETGTSDDTITSALVHMSEGSPFTNLFRGLQTQHQQFAYFSAHFGLVVRM